MMPMLGMQLDVGTKDYVNIIGAAHQFPKPRSRVEWHVTLKGSVYPQGWGPYVTTSGWGGPKGVVLEGGLDDVFNITNVSHAACTEKFRAPGGLLVLLQNDKRVMDLSCANQNVTIVKRERIKLPDETIPAESKYHRCVSIWVYLTLSVVYETIPCRSCICCQHLSLVGRVYDLRRMANYFAWLSTAVVFTD
jgi:hypothetical protein